MTESRKSGSNRLAAISFVLGIATFAVPIIAAIPAVLLGFMGLMHVKKRRVAGAGMAWGGILLGLLGNVMLWPYYLTWKIIEEAPQRRHNARNKLDLLNNMAILAQAMQRYHDVHKHLPTPALPTRDGKPGLSWRVAILPFVEETALYQQFRLDEPWDSPHNLALLPKMPRIYAPIGRTTPEPHCTFYQVFTGPNTLFAQPFEKRDTAPHWPGGIPDGRAYTGLVVEAGQAVPWTKPADLEINPGLPLPKLGGGHPDGFPMGMADGSVRFIDPRKTSEATMISVIHPDDVLGPSDW